MLLNVHIILESVLMLFTKNYQNYSILVETTACKIWRVFSDTVCVQHPASFSTATFPSLIVCLYVLKILKLTAVSNADSA